MFVAVWSPLLTLFLRHVPPRAVWLGVFSCLRHVCISGDVRSAFFKTPRYFVKLLQTVDTNSGPMDEVRGGGALAIVALVLYSLWLFFC